MARFKLIVSLVLVVVLGATSTAAAAKPKPKLPAQFVGMLASNVLVYDQPSSYRLGQLQEMSAAGVRIVRAGFDASRGVAASDPFVLDAARAHVRVMPMLLDSSRFHAAPGRNHGYRPPNTKSYTRYAAAVARRYGSNGTLWKGANAPLRRYAITSYQVWNEPNLPVYWLPKPNPKAYVKLVKATGAALHRVQRKAQVISAGIPDSTQSKPLSYSRYLTGFLKAGGWRYVNAIGVHAYTHTVGQFQSVLKTYRRILDRNRGRKLHLWINEFGWADAGHRNSHVVGAKGQASRITAAYSMVAKVRKKYKIDGLMYFEWKDYPLRAGDPRGDTWGYHTGLLRTDGSAKPAYYAWAKAVARLMR